jgi:hypothetical protein
MRPIVLSSVACLAVRSFPHYLTNGTILGRILLNTKRVLIFSTSLSEMFPSLRRTARYYNNLHWSLGKVPVSLVTF